MWAGKLRSKIRKIKNSLWWKGPLEIYSILLFKAGLTSKLDQAAWGSVQLSFENVQGQKFHDFSGLPVPVLNHSVWIFFFLISSQNFPFCVFCLLSVFCSPLQRVWLMFSLSASFLWCCFSAIQCPASTAALSVLCPRCMTLYFPLLNFMKFPSPCSSNLSRSFWIAALPSAYWLLHPVWCHL